MDTSRFGHGVAAGRRLGVAGVMALLASSSALAQEGGRISDDDLFLIQGQVQKPEVVVVIPRENLDKGFVLELRESFLHRIIDATRRWPF